MLKPSRIAVEVKFQISTVLWLAALWVFQSRVEAYDFIDMPGFYKYIVAVKTKTGVCTGSVINKDWILTAGHCLYQDGSQMKNEDVLIMAGITNYEFPQLETGQFRSPGEIKVHPRFWDNRLAKFDIALVRVNDSFNFNDFVGNITVAGDGWPFYDEKENNCMSLGFGGALGNASPVKRLKLWNVTAAYGGEACPCTRHWQYKRLVCAKNRNYARLCRGDDGGPLICGTQVRAIAHMVRNWYQCSEDPVYPMDGCVGSPERGLSIYMLLCPFNDWMHSVVEDIPPSPAVCGAVNASALVPLVVLSFIFSCKTNM